MQLVLSGPFDAHADHLIDTLRARGAEVVRFNPADFPARAEISLEHTASGLICTLLRADGQIVDLDRVRSVWWRPPHPSGADTWLADSVPRPHVGQQPKSFAQDAWSFLNCAWLPARPAVVQRAQSSGFQLALAGQLGFELLPTAGTRDAWSTRGGLRVVVVGERVFAAEIGSPQADPPRLDWPGLDSSAPAYRQHTLPDRPRQRCIRLVRYLGLRYGALDMVRTSEGEYIFAGLEPNAQHLWIERATGMPITAAIADELLAPASRRHVALAVAPGLSGVAA